MPTRYDYNDKVIQEYIWLSNALIHEHRKGITVKTAKDLRDVLDMHIDGTLNHRLRIALLGMKKRKSTVSSKV